MAGRVKRAQVTPTGEVTERSILRGGRPAETGGGLAAAVVAVMVWGFGLTDSSLIAALTVIVGAIPMSVTYITDRIIALEKARHPAPVNEASTPQAAQGDALAEPAPSPHQDDAHAIRTPWRAARQRTTPRTERRLRPKHLQRKP